ncbi:MULTISPECIES: hypothetical protein [unclassified Bradyrhizobium]|uniref:hypothetical protein n=1 Tax=unclassified Bradyrhizobium TaxID=2631580 RepID=UPI001FF56C9B|nr:MULTISPECIES: hypothetical protein [unclassified Bradyrhizobium]MCJ9704351.1 hypothetical protein [Bradyrhizobium sp. SHOUNA76]MCJ9735581.1 hypothetical protein [Bradyrhizobium sp. PRIMUS42]
MTMVRHGARAPARWRMFAYGLVLLAMCLLAASAGATLPHLFPTTLTLDSDAKLPAPTRYNYRGIHTTLMRGVEAPLRVRLEATVPAALGDVLAFYRTELGRLGWQEQHDDAVIGADQVQLAFVSPLGPAALKLDRKDSGTSVHLVQKNAETATKANVLPEPGQAKLVFSNIGDKEAVLEINEQTIPRRAGANAVALDLVPGKYPYRLGVPGHPATTNILTVAAGDTWELTVGRDGDAWPPLQLY